MINNCVMVEKQTEDFVGKLLSAGFVGSTGYIDLTLMGVTARLNDKSAVGYLLQEWLWEWSTLNFPGATRPDNSQEFPDFYLGGSGTTGLLELKTFDADASANFDLANFDAYCRSLRTRAYRLDADYLVVSYSLRAQVLKIEKIWTKKIWELCSPSKKFPLKTQNKQQKIYNIRPGNFVTGRSVYPIFRTRLQFVSAIRETLAIVESRDYADDWFAEVEASYSRVRGLPL